MPNPETFDGINPRGTETLIPCKDATARSGIEAINGKIPSAASSDNKLVDTTAMNTALENKVDKVAGKGLSANDYTNADKAVVSTAQDNNKANTQLIKDTVGWSGKNKLQNLATNQTASGGGTVTVNADKSITLNGTFNERKDIYLEQNIASRLGNGNYKLSGCTGGSASTYRLQAITTNSSVVKSNDTEPVEFATSEFGGDINVRLVIYSGAVFSSPVTIYPMITDADIIDLTYEPYFGSTAFPRSEQAVLGAKNLLYPIKSTASDKNITVNINADNSATVSNTTATGGSASLVCYKAKIINGTRYKLTGCPSGGSVDSYILSVCDSTGTPISELGNIYDEGNGLEFIATVTMDIWFRIRIKEGYTCNNLVFYPMLRLASDPDDTYVPYVMTNRELTEKVQGIIDAATNAADFAAFKTAIGNL